MLKHLDKYFFPLISVLLPVGYIHLLQYLLIRGSIPAGNVIYLFFVPILLFELWATVHFKKRIDGAHRLGSLIKTILAFMLGSAFWAILFAIWVLTIADTSGYWPGWKYYGPNIHLFAIILWKAMGWAALFALIIWLAIHYILTIRLRKCRILTVAVAPIAITFLFFYGQFLFGGLGHMTASKIEEQQGVKKYFDKDELESAIQSSDPSKNRLLDTAGDVTNAVDKEAIGVKYHPRDIALDEANNAFIITFGCTYCGNMGYHKEMSPMVVGKNLESNSLNYLLGSYNIRLIESTDSSIYFAPWRSPFIFELSKSDLSIKKRIHNQVQSGEYFTTSDPNFFWEPMDLLKDIDKNRLYVSNEIHPALLSYDLDTDKLIGVVDFQRLGLVNEGGIAYQMVQSRKTGLLYVITVGGRYNLAEIDPDAIEITRLLDLDDSGGSALTIDSGGNSIYYQSGLDDDLYRIGTDEFKVERKYKGELHARAILLDEPRDALYVLGYFSGKVRAIDLKSGERLWELRVGGRPHGMALSGDALWVSSMDGVFKLDLNTVWRSKGYVNARFNPVTRAPSTP